MVWGKKSHSSLLSVHGHLCNYGMVEVNGIPANHIALKETTVKRQRTLLHVSGSSRATKHEYDVDVCMYAHMHACATLRMNE